MVPPLLLLKIRNEGNFPDQAMQKHPNTSLKKLESNQATRNISKTVNKKVALLSGGGGGWGIVKIG